MGIKYSEKKRIYTGTNDDDVLDSSLLNYEPKGKTNIKKNKGLTISGGNGNDEIIGTDYNDVIKGGNGNDTIEGGIGADTITGGAGTTIINYTKGDGNDVINLTKGENFTLNLKNLAFDDLRFEYANKNKDLRIYTSKTSDEEYITLKNFVKKNVTNNSNTKKSIVDTSSVKLNVDGKTYDLRTSKNLTDNKEVVLYTTTLGENAKNYTGTWLNDEIDAGEVKLYKKVKQGKKKVTVEKDAIDTGLTIKGGAGNDIITGTKYSDKIYGNKGNDTINAGTGNNYLYFNKGDGNNIIENGGGVDTLVFAKGTKLSYSFDKCDLIIKYFNNDFIVIKDYLIENTHSVKYIKTGTKKNELNPFKNIISFVDTDKKINGTETDDYILGSEQANEIYAFAGNDIIYGGNGDITIHGGTGNDIIFAVDGKTYMYGDTGNDVLVGGKGTNYYYFDPGCGDDIIMNTEGKAYIQYQQGFLQNYEKDNNDLVMNFAMGEYKDSITLKDYFINQDISYELGYTSHGFKINQCVISGTNDNDNLSITTLSLYHSAQYIYAGNGDDIISGLNKTQVQNRGYFLYGENGNDTIIGGYENDNIYGGVGNDYIEPGTGTNNLYGGIGDDTYANCKLTNKDIIFDESGKNDKLIIEANKEDVLLSFDLKLDENGKIIYDFSNDVHITNGHLQGVSTGTRGITIQSQFSENHCIETITTADNYYLTMTQINQLRSSIATWLYDNNFDSVQQIIDSDNQIDKNNLIAEFQKIEWQHI